MHTHWNWYQNEQEKREERRNNYDVTLINQALQRILHQLEPRVQREAYEKWERETNHVLSHSGIWHLMYVNNLENPQVALEQAIFIQRILAKENFEDTNYLREEVNRAMRRLGNVDWSLFGEYNRRMLEIR